MKRRRRVSRQRPLRRAFQIERLEQRQLMAADMPAHAFFGEAVEVFAESASHQGDINGDGRTDLLAWDSTSGDWIAAVSDGAGFTTRTVGWWNPNRDWGQVIVADINGDGLDDVLGRDQNSGHWLLSESDGALLFNRTVGRWSAEVDWTDTLIGDFTGDGAIDILGRHVQTGDWWLSEYDGEHLQNQRVGRWSTAVEWLDVQTIDLDGDGKLEIIGRDGSRGHWWRSDFLGEWLGNQLIGRWSEDELWEHVATGDINGDGLDDIVGFDARRGDWWATMSDGSLLSNQRISYWSPEVEWSSVRLVDVNRDGADDLVGFYAPGGEWWASLSGDDGFEVQRLGTWDFDVDTRTTHVGQFDLVSGVDFVTLDAGAGQWRSSTIGFDTLSADPLQSIWSADGRYEVLHDRDFTRLLIIDHQLSRRADVWLNERGTGVSALHMAGDALYYAINDVASGAIFSIDLSSGSLFAGGGPEAAPVSRVQLEIDPAPLRAIRFIAAEAQAEVTDIDGVRHRLDLVTGKKISQGGNVGFIDNEAGQGTGDSNAGSENGPRLLPDELLGYFSNPAFTSPTYQGDINGDGRTDLLAWDSTSGDWIAAVSDGEAFTTRTVGWWNPNRDWGQVIVADINGDGLDDVLGRDQNSGHWLLSESDGALLFNRTVGRWSAEVDWTDTMVGDFTGDGAVDILGRHVQTGDWWLSEYDGEHLQNHRVGRWSTAVEWLDVQTIDLDGDGKLEIIGRDGSRGHWWRSALQGEWLGNRLIGRWSPYEQWEHVTTGDVDGDGLDDIVGFDARRGNWWAALSDGSLLSNRRISYWSPHVEWNAVQLVDVNGDGADDLVGFYAPGGEWWASLSGGDRFEVQHLGTWDFAVDSRHMHVGQFGGASGVDFVGWDAGSGEWRCSTTGANAEPGAPEWVDWLMADFNGDGREDILARDSVTGEWRAFTFDGDTIASRRLGSWSTEIDWRHVRTGDINGDGRDDILGQDASSGDWWAALSDGDGLSTRRIGHWAAASDDFFLEVGDFNGDGRDDVIAFDPDSRYMWAGVSDGEAIDFSLVGGIAAGVDWRHVSLADINGDGLTDLVLWDSGRGYWRGALSNGQAFHNRLLGRWSPDVDWTSVLVMDFNGDGKDDIAGRIRTGSWHVSLSTGAALVNGNRGAWSTAIDWPHTFAADINGDGRQDIIAYEGAADSRRVIAAMSDGQRFTSEILGEIAGDGEIEFSAAADFNGDGADEFVYRLASGQWRVITFGDKSLENAQQVLLARVAALEAELRERLPQDVSSSENLRAELAELHNQIDRRVGALQHYAEVISDHLSQYYVIESLETELRGYLSNLNALLSGPLAELVAGFHDFWQAVADGTGRDAVEGFLAELAAYKQQVLAAGDLQQLAALDFPDLPAPADPRDILENLITHGAELQAKVQTDLAAKTIRIETEADVEQRRRLLIEELFDGDALPQYLPRRVTAGAPSPISGLTGQFTVEQIDIEMQLGFTSTAYHFVPSGGAERLMIYHAGHSAPFEDNRGADAIQHFLDQGFAVLAFRMPLLGPNEGPVGSHHDMRTLATDTLNPVRFFVEPIAVSLNYVEQHYGYSDISMMGISGGGWTTTLYAAIDTRIKLSVPVAGSIPNDLRQGADLGDWEQTTLSVYSVANYRELYVMGSFGAGRRQLQVLNRFDSCCFAGRPFEHYQNEVQTTMAQLGQGRFDVLSDLSHTEHIISPFALGAVDALLAQR